MSMARKGRRSTGKLAVGFAITMGIVGFVGGLLVAIALIQNLGGLVPQQEQDAIGRVWGVGLLMAALSGAGCAAGGWVLGGKIGARITDIGLAVSKLGRGGSEVRVRNSGNDEVSALGALRRLSCPTRLHARAELLQRAAAVVLRSGLTASLGWCPNPADPPSRAPVL